MNEKLEVDIIINGKKAKATFKDLENAQTRFTDNSEKKLDKLKTSWTKVGGAIALVSSALKGLTEGYETAKTFDMLYSSNRKLISGLSNTLYTTNSTVSSLALLSQTLGVNDEAMAGLVTTAIGLSRTMQDSDVKELTKNLAILTTTGELTGDLADLLAKDIKFVGEESLTTSEMIELLTLKASRANRVFAESAVKTFQKYKSSGLDVVGALGKMALEFNITEESLSLLTDEFKGTKVDTDKLTKALIDLAEKTENAKTKSSAFENSLETLREKYKENGSAMEGAYTSAFDSIAESMANFVMTGKMDLESLGKTITQQILKIKIAQIMLETMNKKKDTASTTSMLVSVGNAKSSHTGGFIPSHHTGSMRGDERIAKLQVGEAVINRAGTSKNKKAIEAMNRGQDITASGGNYTTANINFNITAIDSADFSRKLAENKRAIEGIVSSSINSNGSVRQAIKQSAK